MIRFLHDLLYPRGAACLYCRHPRKAGDDFCLCPDCLELLENLRIGDDACPKCMSPLSDNGACAFCKQKALGRIQTGFAPFRYQGIARHLILLLKFHYTDEAAAALAESMLPLIPPGAYDALVPVPLHHRKQRHRGANQAETLCRLIAPKAGLPVLFLLTRVRSTRPQKNLTPFQRQKNVRGAFTASRDVHGLKILLVDDIRTTGATARECAQALLHAGAKSVSLLTAAIADKNSKE